MGIVAINRDSLEQGITALENAANGFSSRALSPVDNRSTITANGAAREAFSDSQVVHGYFSDALVVSAGIIEEIGDSFFEGEERYVNAMRSN